MPHSTASPECLVSHFSYVRSAHHDRYASGTDRIGHAICLRDHPGHSSDPDESNILFAHVTRDAVFIHRLSVAINQEHLVAKRRQGLKKEHPKMRHEIACYAVVGVVKQNSHSSFSILEIASLVRVNMTNRFQHDLV